MLMYTVLDSASQAYLPPFTLPSERDAVESFKQAAHDPQSNISKFPADFTLIQIGKFDQFTGTLTKLEQPKTLMSAASLLKDSNV